MTQHDRHYGRTPRGHRAGRGAISPHWATVALLCATGAGAVTVTGRVPGSFDVTQSGAATYAIPIEVAAGVSGLKPALTLVYNSQGGEGVAGRGWSLAGLSEITRCGLTRALDGRVQGVRFTTEDRFCLDGHPLVLVSGMHAADGSEYRPEVHQYERVIARGQQGSGPTWFELRLPGGLVYRYGSNSDARVEAPGTAEVAAWALNEIEDRYQQRIGFVYAEDTVNGEHHPSEIRWTYGAAETSAQARYRLLMRWEQRPPGEERYGYVWRAPWRLTQRLAAVDYEYDDGGGFRRVHRYALDYVPQGPEGPHSKVQSVSLCGAIDCLPATAFRWDEWPVERTAVPVTDIPVDKTVFGDFNGDGATDVFGGYQGRWVVWPANPQSGGFGSPLVIGGSFLSSSIAIPVDYNGDGLTDLMAGSSQGPNWLVYLSPATPGAAFQVKNTGLTWSASTEVEPMDIDADGLDDLVYLRNGIAYVRRNLGGSLAPEQASGIAPVTSPYIAFSGGHGFVKSADFDGDGRRDLLVARSQSSGTTFRWEAFLSTGTGFARDPIATFTTSPNRWNVLVLDMNGDGLSDVLRYDGGAWRVLISRGTGSESVPGLLPSDCPAPLTEAAGNKVAPIDTDGDGRSELVIRSYGAVWALHSSDGQCFSSASGYRIISSPNSIDYGRVVPIDSDGDGNPDIMFGSAGLQRWMLSRPVLPLRPDGATVARRGGLLREVSDGLGNVHEVRYRTLSGWAGYQAAGPGPAGSRLLRGAPLTVVSDYVADAGDARYSVSLAYTSARIDLLGRGLLGFENVRATDSRSGLVTETRYRQDFPFIGRTEQATVWDGTRKVSAYDPSWASATRAAADAAGDVHFVFLAADVREDYEVDSDGGLRGSLVRSTSRSLGWNLDHGALASEQVTVTSPLRPGEVFRTTTTLSLDETLRSSSGCLGFANRVDVTREASGAPARTRSSLLYYQAATCRLVISVEGANAPGPQQLWTIYSYDAAGRPQMVTRTDGASAQPPRQTRYSYGGAGFRPTSESYGISGEGELVIAHAWDDALGLESTRTSAQGTTTAWQYDEFGRVRSEIRPSGNSQTSFAACGPCFATGARYAVRQLRSDGFWTETQHDLFGRVVGRAFVLPDGRASRQLIEYDAMGRPARQSVPFVEDAGSVFWTTYQHDLLGRVRSVDRPVSAAVPSGALSTLTYAGTTVSVRDPEMRSTSYNYDPEGRLTAVLAPLGGGATYAYDAFGQLTAITDPGGNTRRFGYDERGRLTTLSDPDAGDRTFAYNAYGELVSQSDGRSPAVTATLAYDELGRLRRRTEPEGVTTWNYSTTAGASRGLLQEVTGPTLSSPTGFRQRYGYDTRSRLQQETTIIDGSAYVTDYGYDADGNLQSMTYPSTVGWRPKFLFGYSRGHLLSINQENPVSTAVYSLLAMDALGRDTEVLYGTATARERAAYDPATTRLSAIASGAASGAADLQNYVYEWDRVGNLVARRDLGRVPAREERFSYDDLNRLIGATLDGAASVALAYGADGNILSKSDVGNYSYAPAGHLPHAVASVSGGPRGAMSFGYDPNGNMVNRNGTTLSWTSFNLPQQASAGADYAKFVYGPDRTRIRQDLRTGSVAKTIHYVGPHFEVELEGPVRRYRSNVFAYGRAVYSQLETTPSGLEAYYVLRDHQGSVDRLVRAVGAGADSLALSFDAWGKRRNADWSGDPIDQRYGDGHWIERGYTGHEHLDNVRLVHMNGRLEDPLLGRMLSPDPVLGSLALPQALNPYSYVTNAPVSHLDPSGYSLRRIGNFFRRGVRQIGSFGRRLIRGWGRQIAAVAAAYVTAGVVSSWATVAQMPDLAVSIGAPSLLAADGLAVAGTLSAAVPAGIILGGISGGAIAGGIATGSVRGAALGGLTGGVMAGIGGYYGGAYGTGRLLAEASVGGAAAELQGDDFRSGFLLSGALSSLTWASLEMRRLMIEQSRLNPQNASGPSAGFGGDRFKLGGCRAPCRWSPLGGVQGGAGQLLGIAYEPGSFADLLVETYAGPHDFLNAPFFYDQLGNNVGRPLPLDAVNAANVLVATPFAAASVVPSYAYAALGD